MIENENIQRRKGRIIKKTQNLSTVNTQERLTQCCMFWFPCSFLEQWHPQEILFFYLATEMNQSTFFL